MSFLNTGILIVLLAVTARATATTSGECPLLTLLRSSIEDCIKCLKPSAESIQLVTHDKGSDSSEANCLRACALRKTGVLKNSKLNINKLEKKLLNVTETCDQGKVKQIISGLRQCKKEAEVTKDACDVIGNYVKCSAAINNDKIILKASV